MQGQGKVREDRAKVCWEWGGKMAACAREESEAGGGWE